jgi:peptidoglycan/LPS O-acetylase OafA/YrhL
MRLPFKKIQPGGDIHSIELLRGIASAMVCFFHLSNGNKRFLPHDSLVWQTGNWGWTGVEIFFVISGFIIPYAMFSKSYVTSDVLTFLKKRIIRIDPPYLISIVLVIGLNFLSTFSPSYRGAPFSIKWGNTAGHLAYLNSFTGAPWLNAVYWSLAIEFQYYLLIALSFSLLTSGKQVFRLLFFVIFGAASFLALPANAFIFSFAGYFLAGILLFQFVCGIISGREFGLLMTITFGLLFYKHGPIMTALVVFTLLIIMYVNKVPSFLRWLGMISYSLYLIHIPLGGRIVNIAEVKIHNVFLRECTVFVAFFICIAAAALFYKYVEKTFKRLSSTIRYEDRVIPELKSVLE